ncbi:RNA chaperone ProQ [Candidatus Regiella endosymbiont of Tuberolachnus salignus]|uniref:RNA chaperone ProQ n=1 Tax=Candidatus Regiella endosymbiont of Tuberolachnus salignus TaxID=3077956 RepID=UPI0030D02ECD
MENQPKLNNNKEIIAFLAERFPQCFTTKGKAFPLKIGIFQDLVARIEELNDVSKTKLRAALRRYTSSWRYLYEIKIGIERVDLNGNPCGKLEQQHVEYAKKQLEEAKAHLQLKKAEQQIKKPKPTAPNAKIPTQQQPKHSPPPDSAHQIVKPIPVSSTPSITMPELKIGQTIKVKAGGKAMNGTILEFVKNGIRVQLSSGLAMIVRAEHLQF